MTKTVLAALTLGVILGGAAGGRALEARPPTSDPVIRRRIVYSMGIALSTACCRSTYIWFP
jgi:hypothetical protein